MESKDKKPSLSKVSWYLVIVKIIKIKHLKGHISQKNHDSKIIFMEKWTLHCCCTCTKILSFCYIILIFSCIFSSRLWRTFLRNTLYRDREHSRSNGPDSVSAWWLLLSHFWVMYLKNDKLPYSVNSWSCGNCWSHRWQDRPDVVTLIVPR